MAYFGLKKGNKVNIIKTSAIVASLILPILSFAADDVATALAKKAQNPLTSMISFPIQPYLSFDIGPDNEAQSIFNIQPVIPFGINDEWTLITRTIMPVMNQPKYLGGKKSGLGNTTFLPYFSPQPKNGLTWGVAPVLMLPATNKVLGSREWGSGISGGFILSKGKWVVGSVVTQLWAPSGKESEQVNYSSWQYFLNYNLGDGLYLSSIPINTYDVRAESGERWTIPVGGGVGQVFKYGDQSINAKFTAYKNVVKPTKESATWAIMMEFTFLFPK